MKRLLVIDVDGRLATAASWPSVRGGDLLLAPRPEYEVLNVEVPPVRADRLDAALPWRIRALYPGPTESTVLDHRPIPGDREHRLVFVVDRSALADLRTAAAGRPLAASSLLLAAAPMREPWIGILWTSVWAEIVCFEGNAVIASRPIPEYGDGAVDGSVRALARARILVRALKEAPEGPPIVVAYTQDAESDRGDLEGILDTSLPGRNVRILPFADLVPRPSIESCAIFRERKAPPILSTRNIARILIVLALLLSASMPYRIERIRKAELVDIKSEYEAAKNRSGAIMERAAEYDRLAARKQELEASHQPDAYRLLADLASGVGPGVRARSLTLEGVSFRLEAEGSDGLTVLKRMQGSGLFESVELRQSVAAPSGGERFTLWGSVQR